MPTIWLDSAPRSEVDEHGVVIQLDLGDDTARYRMARSAFREFLERGLRAMDAADREQQARVIQLRRACPLPEHLRCG